MEDVARIAGVSHQTVSRVVNKHPNVSEVTREKVESAIAALGYRRNTAARSLVTRRSQTIGVIACELSEYGPANTLLGVEQAARDAGYFVSIAAVKDAARDSVLDAIGHFTEQAVEGVVMLARHANTLLALEEMRVPVPVVAAGSPGNSTIQGAVVDQRQGARMAVGHLIELGHRHIGHICGPPGWTDSDERAAGWREALRGAGLPDQMVVEGDWSAGSGYDIGRVLDVKSVTALFVGNDQMALGILRAFAERSLRVPHDISLVGFDDQPDAGYFTPPLTTVRQDFEELGHRCVSILLEQIEEFPRVQSVIVPRLVQRASTAPPPAPPSTAGLSN